MYLCFIKTWVEFCEMGTYFDILAKKAAYLETGVWTKKAKLLLTIKTKKHEKF